MLLPTSASAFTMTSQHQQQHQQQQYQTVLPFPDYKSQLKAQYPSLALNLQQEEQDDGDDADIDDQTINTTSATSEKPRKKKRAKRHNLKLAIELKDRFREPFGEHLSLLMECLVAAKSSHGPPGKPHRLLNEAKLRAPKGCGWTVWLSLAQREKFLLLKSIHAPGTTHTEFIELLLFNNECNPNVAPASPYIPLKSESNSAYEPEVPCDAEQVVLSPSIPLAMPVDPREHLKNLTSASVVAAAASAKSTKDFAAAFIPAASPAEPASSNVNVSHQHQRPVTAPWMPLPMPATMFSSAVGGNVSQSLQSSDDKFSKMFADLLGSAGQNVQNAANANTSSNNNNANNNSLNTIPAGITTNGTTNTHRPRREGAAEPHRANSIPIPSGFLDDEWIEKTLFSGGSGGSISSNDNGSLVDDELRSFVASIYNASAQAKMGADNGNSMAATATNNNSNNNNVTAPVTPNPTPAMPFSAFVAPAVPPLRSQNVGSGLPTSVTDIKSSPRGYGNYLLPRRAVSPTSMYRNGEDMDPGVDGCITMNDFAEAYPVEKEESKEGSSIVTGSVNGFDFDSMIPEMDDVILARKFEFSDDQPSQQTLQMQQSQQQQQHQHQQQMSLQVGAGVSGAKVAPVQRGHLDLAALMGKGDVNNAPPTTYAYNPENMEAYMQALLVQQQQQQQQGQFNNNFSQPGSPATSPSPSASPSSATTLTGGLSPDALANLVGGSSPMFNATPTLTQHLGYPSSNNNNINQDDLGALLLSGFGSSMMDESLMSGDSKHLDVDAMVAMDEVIMALDVQSQSESFAALDGNKFGGNGANNNSNNKKVGMPMGMGWTAGFDGGKSLGYNGSNGIEPNNTTPAAATMNNNGNMGGLEDPRASLIEMLLSQPTGAITPDLVSMIQGIISNGQGYPPQQQLQQQQMTMSSTTPPSTPIVTVTDANNGNAAVSSRRGSSQSIKSPSISPISSPSWSTISPSSTSFLSPITYTNDTTTPLSRSQSPSLLSPNHSNSLGYVESPQLNSVNDLDAFIASGATTPLMSPPLLLFNSDASTPSTLITNTNNNTELDPVLVACLLADLERCANGNGDNNSSLATGKSNGGVNGKWRSHVDGGVRHHPYMRKESDVGGDLDGWSGGFGFVDDGVLDMLLEEL
ncbi:hypothetical protein HDU76_010067 [Blyttiomyces sp. JEL0837]|nr:hypothetical protein HDU76_010067 [Blyttiomyces sp. JEL0837]